MTNVPTQEGRPSNLSHFFVLLIIFFVHFVDSLIFCKPYITIAYDIHFLYIPFIVWKPYTSKLLLSVYMS